MNARILTATAFTLGAALATVGYAAGGCTTAQKADVKAAGAVVTQDAHSLTTSALGLVTQAIDDPAALDEAKSVTAQLVQALDPSLAPTAVTALAHLSTGNLQEAQTVLKGAVAVTAAASALLPSSTAPLPSSTAPAASGATK